MKKLLLSIAALLCMSVPAMAANCAAYPYTLTNGQTADANQVMANFNSILSCGNTALLGANNNLSDLNNDATARTNLGLGASAVEGLSNATAGAVRDDGAGNLVVTSPTFHSQTLGTSGTFLVPSNATTATVFKFTASGAGAGGGGQQASGSKSGAGGSSGGAVIAYLSGFTPSTAVTVTIGSGGSAGTGSNGAYGAGGTTLVTYSATNVISCTGGGGNSVGSFPSALGVCSISVSGSGLTLASQKNGGAQPGSVPGVQTGGSGGGNVIGSGGVGGLDVGSGGAATAGTFGGGGGGGSFSSNNTGGATGGDGVVDVEWVL